MFCCNVSIYVSLGAPSCIIAFCKPISLHFVFTHSLSSAKGMEASAPVVGWVGGCIPMMQEARIGHSHLPGVEFRLLLHRGGMHMQAAIRTPALCAHPASYKEQLCYANIASACSLYYVRILLPCSTIWSSNLNGEKIVETNCSVTYSGLF